MARCPILRPETVRVTLPDGEWLVLAKELTAGEYRDVFIGQFKDATAGEKPIVDMKQLGIGRALAYIKEWSYVDFQEQPLPITEDWLRKFDKETFADVIAAVEAHDDACEAAAKARKNVPAGATTS